MQLLTMLRFQDLFVLQVLGNLLSKQYVGMVNFLFEAERTPTSVWLNTNGITHIQRQTATDIELLYEIIWLTQGKVGLYPKISIPTIPPLNFSEVIEIAAVKLLPPLPLSCPMLEHSYLHYNTQRAAQSSLFAELSKGLINKIPAAGTTLAQIRADSNETTFWPSLIYLASNGQVLCSYELTLGRLLQKFEAQLLVRLTSLFGARALVPFTRTVHATLQDTWPDWVAGTLPDSVYGAAPYYLWAKTLKTQVVTLGMPTVANRCFEQSVEKLTAAEANLLRFMCNWLFT